MIRLAILLLVAVQQVGSPRTATISGIVVDENGGPLGRAWLGLTSPALPGARTAISADDGRFVFSDLPAGRFRLQAAKPYHLATEFGQRTPQDLPSLIRLSEGQHVTDLRLRLPRAASIRGRIVDQAGKPAVYVWEDMPLGPDVQPRDDHSQPRVAFYASADGRGGFKVEGLPGGAYRLRASPNSPFVDVVLADGQRLSDVVLPLTKKAAPTPTSEIEGDVLGPDGGPMQHVNLHIVSRERDPPPEFYFLPSPQVDDRGHFVIRKVPIGRYTLMAKGTIFSGPAGGQTFRSSWASVEIVVVENGKSYAYLALQHGGTVRGRILVDSMTAQAPPLSKLAINLLSQDGSDSLSQKTGGHGPSQIFPDGSFTVSNVPPGRYTVGLWGYDGDRNLLEDWFIDTATLNGADVLDLPFTVTDRDVAGITVRLSEQVGVLEGTIKDAAGEPVIDSTVIAFPVDTRAWTARARRIRAVRADTAGTFSIADLPGGEYFVAAVSQIESDAWFDPKLLAALAGSATRASIAGSTPVRVALTVR